MKVKMVFLLSLYVLFCVLATDVLLHHYCMMSSDVFIAMVLLYPMPGVRRLLPVGMKIICCVLTLECLLAILSVAMVRFLSVPLHAALLYGYLLWLQVAPYLHRCHTLLHARRLRIVQIYAEDMSRSYLFFFMTLFTTLSLVLTFSPIGSQWVVTLLWTGLTIPVSLLLYLMRARALFMRRPPFLFRVKALRGSLAQIRSEAAEAQKKRYCTDAGYNFYHRIVDCMARTKPFLSTDFSLMELAQLLGTNTMYVSRTINAMTGRSFPSFVNFFRIRYAVAMYETNPLLRVHMISEMSGFGSTVTFTAAFKAETGYTPGEYFGRMQEGEVMPDWPEYPSRNQAQGWKDEILAFAPDE